MLRMDDYSAAILYQNDYQAISSKSGLSNSCVEIAKPENFLNSNYVSSLNSCIESLSNMYSEDS